MVAFGFQGKIDHHDRVLFHDADEQDDADERDERQVHPADFQRQQRPYPGRGQCGKDRDRVNITLVQHAQHNVDDHECREDEVRLAFQRGAELRRAAAESGHHRVGQTDVRLRLLDRGNGLAQEAAGFEVEGQRHARELSLVRDGQRREVVAQRGERAQRHQLPRR